LRKEVHRAQEEGHTKELCRLLNPLMPLVTKKYQNNFFLRNHRSNLQFVCEEMKKNLGRCWSGNFGYCGVFGVREESKDFLRRYMGNKKI